VSAGFRLAEGGTGIDRSQRLEFRFDDRRLAGFAGDTLASALLANGVRTVARSFKLHRRRGIRAEGWDDPNAFVQLVEPWEEPNLLATRAPLAAGLVARGMHGWPGIEWDVGVVADWVRRGGLGLSDATSKPMCWWWELAPPGRRRWRSCSLPAARWSGPTIAPRPAERWVQAPSPPIARRLTPFGTMRPDGRLRRVCAGSQPRRCWRFMITASRWHSSATDGRASACG
jgi:hypothetical protein